MTRYQKNDEVDFVPYMVCRGRVISTRGQAYDTVYTIEVYGEYGIEIHEISERDIIRKVIE